MLKVHVPDHIHICSYVPNHIHICSWTTCPWPHTHMLIHPPTTYTYAHDPHPHMCMTLIHICSWPTSTYALNHICSRPHTHMLMTTWAYVVDHIPIPVCWRFYTWMWSTTYAPDHIHICGCPSSTYAPAHIHICSRHEPHTHMLMNHMLICTWPHTHMHLSTYTYAPDHIHICVPCSYYLHVVELILWIDYQIN